MKLHDLKPAAGAKHKAKRIGRGIGGKGGKTAGRGTKGQFARNTVHPGFEGGQTPLHRRTPKAKGFNNPFRVEYQAVNLDVIDGAYDAGAVVAPDTMRERGLVHKNGLVKLLGRGEVTKSLTVRVHACSASAKSAIEAAGGSVELLPSPWADRRPPARGNQHANR